EQSFGSLVSGNAMGAVFRYDIASPVTVRDQESALIMIANRRVPGEEVWLYRAGQDGAHPYRAARLTTPPDTVLERGPTSIYRSGTFLGEAMAGHIEAGATVFFPFAVDGRVRIDATQSASEEDARLVRLVAGQLTVETKSVVRHAYDIHNATTERMTLWVARPKRPGWSLVGAPAATVDQSGSFYVPIDLAPSAKTAFEVREETPVQRHLEVMSDDGRRLLGAALSNPGLTPKNAALLREIQELLAQLDSLDAQAQAAAQQKAVFSARQAEVRANLQTLGKTGNASLRTTLEASLAEQERRLEELSGKIVNLSMQRQEVRDKLQRKIGNVTLE
ncbi:MAG TPA: hypothetical protein VFH51_12095, partial [Myxococcota bacterium]|nr:hypothetical protein [Myxococcota bacterium]